MAPNCTQWASRWASKSASKFTILVVCGAAGAMGSATAAGGDDLTPEGRSPAGVETPVERLTKSSFSKFFLRYSPDGTQIAYSRHHQNLRGANQVLVGMRIVGADGAGDRPLLSEFDSQVQIQEHPSWSPNGARLALSGGGNDTGNSTKDVFVCDIDSQFKATNLRKLAESPGVGLGEEPCFSPDGEQLAFVTIDETLWVSDADGKNKVKVVQVDGQYCHQPAWSPDGEWLAFASDRDGNVELYKVRPDGADLTRLTNHAGIDCRPRWSRDGQWILFTSNRDGNSNLFLMEAQGGAARRLTADPAHDDHGAWAPDGRTIAFVSLRDGGFDIYRMSLPADIAIGPAPTPRPKATPSRELAAWYDFDAPGDGERIRDKAGRNALKLNGAGVVPSGRGGALEFDGEKAHAVAGNGAALRIGGPLTLTLWARPAALKGNGYLISKQGWNVYLGADGVPRFETRSAANDAWDTLAAATPLPVGDWTFIATVFDPQAEKVQIFVNGELSAERARGDGGLGAVDAYPLQLGQYTASNTQSFAGRLDEVRIYSRALPAETILQHFREQQELVAAP